MGMVNDEAGGHERRNPDAELEPIPCAHEVKTQSITNLEMFLCSNDGYGHLLPRGVTVSSCQYSSLVTCLRMAATPSDAS